MDETDRKLLALLRHDGRASVTTLAGSLGVSRATVQARVARMLADGTISKFTIETGNRGEQERIRAVMTISLAANKERAVIRALRRMPEMVDLYSTNGKWDLVGMIETANLPSFDRVLREVRQIDGVSASETLLLLDRASA